MLMFIEPGVSLWGALAIIIPIIILSIISIRLQVLDAKGTLLAALTGIIIGVFGHPAWLVVLFIFLVTSFSLTRFKYDIKHKSGNAEGNKGTRRFSNVFYNGLIPILVALFSAGIGDESAWLFITAIAAAASDTFASEIGVLSPRVYLITKPSRNSITSNPAMRISPGIDGGVSLLGSIAALTGSLLISLIGWVIIPWATGIPRTLPLLVFPALLGFVGCNFDSVLGATLETKGYINKGQVNLAEITFATILMAVILVYL